MALASRGWPSALSVCPNTGHHHKGDTPILLATAMLGNDGFDFEVPGFREGIRKQEMVRISSNLALVTWYD